MYTEISILNRAIETMSLKKAYYLVFGDTTEVSILDRIISAENASSKLKEKALKELKRIA